MPVSAMVVGMKPIRRNSLTSQMMDSMRNYIVENNLPPGAKLPSEKELVKQFGVSRNVLREALKGLAAIGLVEARQGDGTYVSSVDYSSLIRQVPLVCDGDELQSIAQAHDFLESCEAAHDNPVLSEFRSLLGRMLHQASDSMPLAGY